MKLFDQFHAVILLLTSLFFKFSISLLFIVRALFLNDSSNDPNLVNKAIILEGIISPSGLRDVYI
ncbi:hypothetical protein yrohd0001_36780 [Yersinia rohdei ATCC 43380]|nr:hypothetical protein yrohd0001_36780 [Yersinia rohdei ATCC 43380]